MNVTACECIMTLSLISISIPAQTAAAAAAQASTPTGEARTPATPGTADSTGTPRKAPPAGKTGEARIMPPNRAQEVENRVRSGQMDQPIAQGEISERLNQLETGKNR
jgi:hypothetical protein